MTATDTPQLPTGYGPLRERHDVLDQLSSQAARARTGTGRLVLLKGATGTGRTALLEAAADRGEELGMRVLRARCSAEDSATAFAAVQQLLGCQADLGPDDGMSRHTHDRGQVWSARHRSSAARLWRLLESYAAGSPLLLAVDDVHLADPSSRRWLTDAARRLDRLPVLLVATERSQYDIDPPSAGLAHALSPTLVRVHALAPLGRAAAEDVIRACSGPDVTEQWVDGCLRAGAGNPLLLAALLDDLRAVVPDGAASASLPESCADLYPGAFAAAVAWWLDSAGPETAEVARTLAELEGLADDGAADALLAGVTCADPVRVSGWLTAMLRMGLLRRGPGPGLPRFTHPLVREAVLDGWPRARRESTQRIVAELRHRRGDGAEAVAAHLLRMPAPGAGWAGDVLMAAADEAVRAGRGKDAARYLRRALDEPLPRDRRATVLTELGCLELGTAPSTGIPRLAAALRLRDRPLDRVRSAITLGTALAHRGEAHAAFAVLRDLDSPLAGDPVLTRTVGAAAALLSDHDREIRQEVYARLCAAVTHSPALVGPAEQALLVRYEATAGLLSAERAMRRMRTLLGTPEHPLLEPYLLGTAAAVAQWADELDDADRLVQRGLADRLSPLHPMHGALLNVRTDTAAARGRHPHTPAGPADQDLPVDADRPGPTNRRAKAVLALVESGRLAEARRVASSADVQNAHDNWELSRFLYARGVLRAASGEAADALDDFLECGRRQTARDVVSPVVTPWRSGRGRMPPGARPTAGGPGPRRGGTPARRRLGYPARAGPRTASAGRGDGRPTRPGTGGAGRRRTPGRPGVGRAGHRADPHPDLPQPPTDRRRAARKGPSATARGRRHGRTARRRRPARHR